MKVSRNRLIILFVTSSVALLSACGSGGGGGGSITTDKADAKTFTVSLISTRVNRISNGNVIAMDIAEITSSGTVNIDQ